MRFPYKLCFITLLVTIALCGNSELISTHYNQPMQLTNPGEYHYATYLSFPGTIDPVSDWSSMGLGINELMYETLIYYKKNSTHELEGQLATSWTISPDGLQYNFTLRSGVYFHDGVEFNAWVMKYCLDRIVIMNDHNGPGPYFASYVKGGSKYMSAWSLNVTAALDYLSAGGIVVEDDYHLTINLVNPHTPFIYYLAAQFCSAISPKAIVENCPDFYTTNTTDTTFGMVPLSNWFSGLSSDYTKLGLQTNHPAGESGVVPDSSWTSTASHSWMTSHAVGTGPYILMSDYSPEANLIQFERNDLWWGTFSSNVVEKIAITKEHDLSIRTDDIESGLVDQIEILPENGSQFIDPTGHPLIIGTTVYETSSWLFRNFGFNMNDTLSSSIIQENNTSSTFIANNWNRYNWGTSKASQRNPFTALEFRKAFSLAYDCQTNIQISKDGFAERQEGLIPKDMFGFHDKLIEDGFIPSYDPETAKAIFEQVGWKGVINLIYPKQNFWRRNFCLLMKNNIESLNVGIIISIEGLDYGDYRDKWINNHLPIYYCEWLADWGDPDTIVRNFVYSIDGFFTPQLHYKNPTIDSWIEAAASEQNLLSREQWYRDIQESVSQDYVFIYGCHESRLTIIRDWIQNYPKSGSLNPVSFMFNAEYLDKVELSDTATTTTTTTKTIIDQTTFPPPTISETSGWPIIMGMVSSITFVCYRRSRKNYSE